MTDRLEHDATTRAQSLLSMVIAPTIWAAHFVVCYAVAAIWCAKRGGDTAGLVWIVVGLTAAALFAIALVGWRAWRQWDYTDDWDYVHGDASDEHRREFLGHVGVLLALVSGMGVVYVALPALLTGVCG